MRLPLLLLLVHLALAWLAAAAVPPVLLGALAAKPNSAYRFRLHNRAAPITIIRNNNGTFLAGNFSSLTLAGPRAQYRYSATALSFKYPAQQRVADLPNELLELQVQYELDQEASGWRHRSLALSVTFLLTEYAPPSALTLGRQIHSGLTNGSTLDLQALLPLLPGLSMLLYKGVHSQQPEEKAFLWLVRKELLLMSAAELQAVKSLIFQHQPSQTLNHHGLLARLSDLNQIEELPSQHDQVDSL